MCILLSVGDSLLDVDVVKLIAKAPIRPEDQLVSPWHIEVAGAGSFKIRYMVELCLLAHI